MVTAERAWVSVEVDVPSWDDRWVLRDDDNMPESPEHVDACALLKDVLRAWIARTGRDAYAGCNIALRWDGAHPQIGVDPDVYLVEPAPAAPMPKSLRTWVPGHHAPRVAVEVVSEDSAEKDYVDGPQRYAASGTRELWVFDPERHGRASVGGPLVLQVWRRMRGERFRRVYAGDGPAYSEELGAWLVVTDEGRRLRVADDEAGERLWPAAAEEADERAREANERTREANDRAREANERAAAAEAELAALRAARGG